MAYSDYGGYVYRNGRRVVERSDCTITPEGDTFGTPGMWPGFAMMAAGMDRAEVDKRLEWPSGHVVIGDGPIYLVLYKQSSLRVYEGPTERPLMSLLTSEVVAAVSSTYKYSDGPVETCVDTEKLAEGSDPLRFSVNGCQVEAYFTYEDNYYQYVRLTQPDGTVWHGWAGYGVGAGLEECGYGYSTEDRERKLLEFWPDAIAGETS